MLVAMINLMFVLRSLKGRCYGYQLMWALFANIKIDRLQSLLWRFVMECSIAICMRVLTQAMMQLHHVKFGKLRCSNPEITFFICDFSCVYWVKIVRRSPFVALTFPNALDD